MREIKFRAWDKTHEVWLNPDNVRVDGSGMVWVSVEDKIDGYIWIARTDIDIVWWTGLKDKKGKEIYEGDIVHLENHKRNHKIIYTLGSFVGKQTKGKFQGYLDGMFFYRAEVIGSIYENKELLNESEN